MIARKTHQTQHIVILMAEYVKLYSKKKIQRKTSKGKMCIRQKSAGKYVEVSKSPFPLDSTQKVLSTCRSNYKQHV